MTIKTMSEHDVKNHFAEFLEAIQYAPITITRDNQPIATLQTMEEDLDNSPIEFGTIGHDEMSDEAKKMCHMASNTPRSSYIKLR